MRYRNINVWLWHHVTDIYVLLFPLLTTIALFNNHLIRKILLSRDSAQKSQFTVRYAETLL